MTHEPCLVADITTLPPPCQTKARALEIYTEPFRRVIEYIHTCNVQGEVAEFGTFNGFTARLIAELLQQYQCGKHLHLFDSWEGFPAMTGGDANCQEVRNGSWKQGDCRPAAGHQTIMILREILWQFVPERLHLTKGFYRDTLPAALPLHISFLHIDCDLYESTCTVLRHCAPLLTNGAVILFDDFNNNLASNLFGERRAFRESTIFPHCEPWFTYGSSGYAFIYHKDET